MRSLFARGLCQRIIPRTPGVRSYSSVTAWGAYIRQFTATAPPADLPGSEHHAQPTPAHLSLPRLFNKQIDTLSISAVGAGVRHALVAATNGDKTDIVGFGLNRCSQLGQSSGDPAHAVQRYTVTGKVVQIACGREHSAMIVEQTDGSQRVLVCGSNSFGQTGLPRMESDPPVLQHSQIRDLTTLDSVLESGEVPVKVQCGLDHTVILTSAGRVFAMGWGADGQLGAGPGSTADHCTPTLVFGLDASPISDISSSTDFTLAVSADNRLFYWGNAEYGQCMTGEKIDRVLAPIEVPFASPIAGIAAGGAHSLVLDKLGQVHVCGYGALGLGSETISVLQPAVIEGVKDVTHVWASTDRCLAVDDRLQVFSWGLGNSAGRLGVGQGVENAFEPRKLDGIDVSAVDPSLVAVGNDIALLATNNPAIA